MEKEFKQRRKKKAKRPDPASPGGAKPSKLRRKLAKFSRLQVLLALLVLSAISGAVLARMNAKEVTTQESPEELEMKRQMLKQFMHLQEQIAGPAGDAPAP